MSHSSGPWAHPPRSRSSMSALYKFLFFAVLVLIYIIATTLSWVAFEHLSQRLTVELNHIAQGKALQ